MGGGGLGGGGVCARRKGPDKGRLVGGVGVEVGVKVKVGWG